MELSGIIAKVSKEVLAQLDGKTAAITPKEVIADISCSMLNPDVSRDEVIFACEEAKKYGLHAVSVFPYYVPMTAKLLSGSGIKTVTVCGYMHSAQSLNSKLCEIREAIVNGACEADVYPSFSALKSGEYDYVEKELAAMLAEANGMIKLKIVYEQGLLSDSEKQIMLKIIKNSGAERVKISNTLFKKDALPEDVKFAKKYLGEDAEIEINGEIKTFKRAKELIAAGACVIEPTLPFEVVKEALKEV